MNVSVYKHWQSLRADHIHSYSPGVREVYLYRPGVRKVVGIFSYGGYMVRAKVGIL